MSFLTAGQLAQDGEFKQRVKVAMVKAAVNVAAETETIYIAYRKRHSYAVSILNDPDSKINAFVYAVAANPAITSNEASDGDIEYTVNSIFGSMAGVKSSDATTESTGGL